MNPLILLPQPQSVTLHGGTTILQSNRLIAIAHPAQLFGAERLQAAIQRALGFHWEIVADSVVLPKAHVGARFHLDPACGSQPDFYRLDIGVDTITITGRSEPALWYGVCTLIQIVEQSAAQLPLLTVEDWPDFERRGVMLDISRDKVPKMETLYALIDRLAGWKINEVQLYCEHTFAYQRHPAVWANASPMTGEQILQLDRFCRERYIDLVPNQNSFGHMHRWLIHDRYRSLAEVPEGFDWPLFLTPRPFSLAAINPGSLELIAGLYDELLPHFSSPYFNVGCDETADLGLGCSRAAVEAQGRGRVYLDFLKQIAGLVRSHGRTMMFWGDIIMEHPELVPELPKDSIALEWGYEADHPFDRDGACFAQAGIKFYVCPGTSSWISLVGRTDNALGNLRNAAINGRKHGAMGYLITDWGDLGHWQPLPVSYLGFAYGAGVAWAIDANLDMDVPAVLNRYAFEDPSGVMGQLAYDLGNVYKLAGIPLHNSSPMARVLAVSLDSLRKKPWLYLLSDVPLPVDPDKARDAMAEGQRLAAQLANARPADPLVVPEYRWAMALWRHGCKRLILLKDDGAFSRESMANDLRLLMEEYRQRWLTRNRPGGLDDSLVRMQRMLAEYETLPVAP